MVVFDGFAGKKMEMLELPRRIYTLGEEPPAVHSISYHTCWTLHAALKKALHDDEYEELKESKLGVFIKRFPSILSNPSFSPPVISPPLSPSFSPPFSQPLPLFKIREETLAHILSEASRKKMEMPELPLRIYTLGEEPLAVHSISYHTCWTLHAALKKALHDDEYEELKESKLGVFIKFQDLVGPQPVRFSLLEFENFTGLNCEYIEDLERPHCVVTKELTSFWEMLGVHVEAGPSTQEIIAAFERCEGWSRDDRKRLAYLAIFTGYIEGRKYSTPTRVSLARLVMELERFENYPWGRVAFKENLNLTAVNRSSESSASLLTKLWLT
ncbi:hypothetical protein F2Q69_00044174 [Brassica cretica]|uniref:DUF1985 domain-containing protein n=1 Tax=Brassica cretica TaxID=69181 RepID=A0A8S9NJR1_BRACR|nr:hypothetical protein F2Q69_00044174 [Brassica cretica]